MSNHGVRNYESRNILYTLWIESQPSMIERQLFEYRTYRRWESCRSQHTLILSIRITSYRTLHALVLCIPLGLYSRSLRGLVCLLHRRYEYRHPIVDHPYILYRLCILYSIAYPSVLQFLGTNLYLSYPSNGYSRLVTTNSLL